MPASATKVEENGYTSPPPTTYRGGMARHKRRSTLHTTLLHVAIRAKYLLSSWFFLKPLLLKDLTAYRSLFRPEGIPEIDYATALGIRLLWIFGMFIRALPPLLFVLVKLRVMHVFNWIHGRLLVRPLFVPSLSLF